MHLQPIINRDFCKHKLSLRAVFSTLDEIPHRTYGVFIVNVFSSYSQIQIRNLTAVIGNKGALFETKLSIKIHV